MKYIVYEGDPKEPLKAKKIRTHKERAQALVELAFLQNVKKIQGFVQDVYEKEGDIYDSKRTRDSIRGLRGTRKS